MGRSRKARDADKVEPADEKLQLEESLDELEDRARSLLGMLHSRRILDPEWWLKMVALKLAISHWGE